MAIEVLIHNVGHHDIWALYGADPDAPCKVENVRTYSFSRDVCAGLDAGAVWSQRPGDVDGVMRFETPLSLKKTTGAQGALAGLCMPILPAVLDRWVGTTSGASERRVVLLHSGYDSKNSAISGPSTVKAAELLSRWLKGRHEGINVDLCVSKSGDPFTFAETSAEFDEVQTLLRGLRRRAAARARAIGDPKKDGWSSYLKLSLSASTGTDAVIWALAAQLMPYRPKLLHVPMARREPSVQRHHAVRTSDASVLRAAPPRAAGEFSPDDSALRDEMVRWRDDFAAAWSAPAAGGELASFWLRKSSKPVLAVLMVRSAGGGLSFFRGCNLEVSMPTGSLCAERNAIGTALAAIPSLARKDILGVAVLSLAEGLNPIDPCGACNEWIMKIAEVSPDFRVLTFANESCEKVFVRHVV